MLETNLDESIISVLGIEPVAGRLLLSYVPFNRKCDFLKKLTSLPELGFTSQELAEAKAAMGSIQKLSEIRNVVAHSFFSADAIGVKFLRAEKNLARDTSKTINNETFERHRNEMADLWGKVAQIAHRIKVKMNERQVAEAMARARFEEDLASLSKPH
jgi:hypothetical protein